LAADIEGLIFREQGIARISGIIDPTICGVTAVDSTNLIAMQRKMR
jgi:hypothetical protein